MVDAHVSYSLSIRIEGPYLYLMTLGSLYVKQKK